MIIMLNYKNELPAYIDEKFSRFKDLFNKIELEKMMEEIHLTQVISKELSENTKLYEVMFLLEQTIGFDNLSNYKRSKRDNRIKR